MTLAEGVQLVTFGILVAMTIGGALGVVLLENIVYSAFLLGIVFVSIAGLYILLNAGFVAAAQVLVYVGSRKRPDFVRDYAGEQAPAL